MDKPKVVLDRCIGKACRTFKPKVVRESKNAAAGRRRSGASHHVQNAAIAVPQEQPLLELVRPLWRDIRVD